MENYQRCPSCRGARKILGMGFIERDCQICDGAGWLKIKDDQSENSKDHAEQNDIENSKNRSSESEVDQGSSAGRKTNRQKVRKTAVGSR